MWIWGILGAELGRIGSFGVGFKCLVTCKGVICARTWEMCSYRVYLPLTFWGLNRDNCCWFGDVLLEPEQLCDGLMLLLLGVASYFAAATCCCADNWWVNWNLHWCVLGCSPQMFWVSLLQIDGGLILFVSLFLSWFWLICFICFSPVFSPTCWRFGEFVVCG